MLTVIRLRKSGGKDDEQMDVIGLRQSRDRVHVVKYIGLGVRIIVQPRAVAVEVRIGSAANTS